MYVDKDMYSGFHESYFAHTCAIMPEKDVVYTDIPGNHCSAFIKRWWRDLFLLSSTNVRSTGFYNSSHAMRIDRFRQFRKYPKRIHPMSKFMLVFRLIYLIKQHRTQYQVFGTSVKNKPVKMGLASVCFPVHSTLLGSFWNCVIVFAVIVNKILFRFTSSIIFENISIGFFFFAACLEVIIIIDIMINMMTGYIDQETKRVVLDSKKGLIHYCSTKLFLHMMSAIPMHWLMFLKYGLNVNCGLCKCNMFISVIKLLNVFGLYRVFETTQFWTWQRSPKKRHIFAFLRIATVGLVTMIQLYDVIDVIWILTVLAERQLHGPSFTSMLMVVRYGIIKNVPSYMVACYDISRIFKSCFLFSFGLQPNSVFVWDKMSSVIAYVIANIFYVWALLECYSMISRQVYPKESLMNARDFLTGLLASRQLSNELKQKIDQYLDFKSSNLKIFEHRNGLFRNLPNGLRKEITLCCYSRPIKKLQKLFRDWPMDIIEALALMLTPEMYLSGDIVAEAWSPALGLMIVDVGVLAVYTVEHEEIGHLIDGDCFGDLCLVTDNEIRMSYVVAITPCRILILDKLLFRDYMRNYPDYFYELKHRLLDRNKRDMVMEKPFESQAKKQGSETFK